MTTEAKRARLARIKELPLPEWTIAEVYFVISELESAWAEMAALSDECDGLEAEIRVIEDDLEASHDQH